MVRVIGAFICARMRAVSSPRTHHGGGHFRSFDAASKSPSPASDRPLAIISRTGLVNHLSWRRANAKGEVPILGRGTS